MTRAALLSILALLCVTPPSAHAAVADTNYDHFTGWFEVPVPESKRREMYLPDRPIIVPMIKRGTNFFTAYIGFEVPFRQTAEGLHLEVDTFESHQRMTIDFRPESGEHYTHIIKRKRSLESSSAHKGPQFGNVECVLVRTSKPASALDATAPAPRKPNDFVGWYQSLYLPFVRAEALEERGELVMVWRYLGYENREKLEPDGDRFVIRQSNGEANYLLQYNDDLKRYELCSRSGDPPIRWPWVRIEPPPPQSTNEPLLEGIGFPFQKD